MHSGHTGTLHLRQQQLSYISLPTARAMYVSTYLAEVQLLFFFFCFFFSETTFDSIASMMTRTITYVFLPARPYVH